MQVELKEDFAIIEDKHKYLIPTYDVEEGVGIVPRGDDFLEIKFVRGSKNPDDSSDYSAGTLHEHLLAVQIYDLEQKYKEFPSNETQQAIINLKQALGWLRQRQIDRAQRHVLGEYKK